MAVDFSRIYGPEDKLINPLVTKEQTAAVLAALTNTQMKSFLNITHTGDDDLLTTFIAMATKIYEEETQRVLLTQTHKLILNDWPSKQDYIEIPFPPLQSVSSITYKDSDGDQSTWGSSSYIVQTEHMPGRVALTYNGSWPSTALYPIGAIEITFIAGYTAAASIPADELAILRMIVENIYLNRGEFELGKGIMRLLQQKKIVWVGNE